MFIIIAKKHKKPRYRSINRQKIRSGKGLAARFFVLIYFSTSCPPTIATNKTGHNKRSCRKLQKKSNLRQPFQYTKRKPTLFKEPAFERFGDRRAAAENKKRYCRFLLSPKIIQLFFCQTCFACAFRCST